jgi:hypothetical protein
MAFRRVGQYAWSSIGFRDTENSCAVATLLPLLE